jgi:hypothetical protein
MKILICLLFPILSFGQKNTFLIDGAYVYSKALGNGYGAKATIGTSIYKSSYIGAGVEVIKFDNIHQPLIPVTLSLFTSPKTSASDFAPMGLFSVGYDMNKNGSFYTSLYAGVKKTNTKACPFILIGLNRPHFSFAGKQIADYVAFSLRAGLAF